jgi:hypothetical protein
MQKGESSRRHGNAGEKARGELGWDGPRRVGPSQLTQPIPGPVHHPFGLANPQAIYSPRAKSHASYHSSFVTEEQRRGHHSGEERVELVD